MAVLARPQLDGSFDVTERRLPKIGCREWVGWRQSISRQRDARQRLERSLIEPFASSLRRSHAAVRWRLMSANIHGFSADEMPGARFAIDRRQKEVLLATVPWRQTPSATFAG
jgi:hypothetical protein